MKTEAEIKSELERLRLWSLSGVQTSQRINTIYESKIEMLEWVLSDRPCDRCPYCQEGI